MALILHPEFQLYEKKSVPLCSSRQIAEIFQKEHKNVLVSIRQAIEETEDFAADFSATNFLKSSFLDRGKSYPEFLLTKDGFSYVAMRFTGKKAAQFRVGLIQRFNAYEACIKQQIFLAEEFPAFAEAVREAHDEPKSYHYSNECDMINRIVLGMTAKQFKELHGLPANVKSIRPFLETQQAKAIRKLQTADVRLLYKGFEFQERKNELTGFFNNTLAIGG